MREGSLEAPIRHPYGWRDPEFTDPVALEAEMRRQFEVCHSCRRCFNLCDSFPRLFDLIDAAGDAELAGVACKSLDPVVDACTLCDMCFMTKCPYVPPHEFGLDIPHLMVRARAARLKAKGVPLVAGQLTETDRNGRLGSLAAPLANWATRRGNGLTRPLMERLAGIHRDAELPRYHRKTLMARAAKGVGKETGEPAAAARKAVIFATCFANYNSPGIGTATQAVLARNGVETALAYPGCCGMPQLEHGDLARVAENARTISRALAGWVDKGWDVVVPVPSCALMMKFEWPLIDPDDEPVRRLSRSVFDVSEYVVDLARGGGLAPGLKPIDGGVAVHVACHARAQNIGAKGAEMLRLIPDTKVAVVERCSGHGGAWGVMKDNFPVAMKVGKPAMRQVAGSGCATLCSECPLAGAHIGQGVEALDPTSPLTTARHPIEILARAYGLG